MVKNPNRYVTILNGQGIRRPMSLTSIEEETDNTSLSPITPDFDLEFSEPLTPQLDMDTPIRKNRNCIRFERPPSMPIQLEVTSSKPNKNNKSNPVHLLKNINKKLKERTSDLKEKENSTESLTMIRPHVMDESTQKNVFGFYVRKSCTQLVQNDFDDMLFLNQDSTLMLSLTPNWLHSKS